MHIKWLRLSPLALAGLLVHCTTAVDEAKPIEHEARDGTDYRVVQLEGSVVIGAEDHTGWLTKINQQLDGDEPRRSLAGGLRVHDVGPLLLQVEGTLQLEANTRVEFPAELFVQAERVVLEQGAVLRVAGAATVHAHAIEGSGRIDTSGGALPELAPVERPSTDPELASVAQSLAPDGSDGDDGDEGDDGRDATCKIFKSTAASAGDDGADGTDGNNGASAGDITLQVFDVTLYNLDASGGDGGNGGNGGDGGDGGDGCCFPPFASPQSGRAGGDGGDGANGGDGGDGGHVKIAYCRGDPITATVDVSGGEGGDPGTAGDSGDGGLDGSCPASVAGNNGSVGGVGLPGASGQGGTVQFIKLGPNAPSCS